MEKIGCKGIEWSDSKGSEVAIETHSVAEGMSRLY